MLDIAAVVMEAMSWQLGFYSCHYSLNILKFFILVFALEKKNVKMKDENKTWRKPITSDEHEKTKSKFDT